MYARTHILTNGMVCQNCWANYYYLLRLEKIIQESAEREEEILSQAETARNEMAKELEDLETEIQRITGLLNKNEGENNQLDQDLNKAVNLLESKDMTIEMNHKAIAELQAKNIELNKTITDLKNHSQNSTTTN